LIYLDPIVQGFGDIVGGDGVVVGLILYVDRVRCTSSKSEKSSTS